MTVRKVSMNHPNFPPDKVFHVQGIGEVTNDGTPVEVDSEDFKAETGFDLEEALAGNAVLSVEGGSKSYSDESATNINDMLTSHGEEGDT